MKFDVYGYTTASVHQVIEIPDAEISGLTKDVIDNLVEETFYHENKARICAQCSGWGNNYSLELSDEWSVEEVIKHHV